MDVVKKGAACAHEATVSGFAQAGPVKIGMDALKLIQAITPRFRHRFPLDGYRQAVIGFASRTDGRSAVVTRSADFGTRPGDTLPPLFNDIRLDVLLHADPVREAA